MEQADNFPLKIPQALYLVGQVQEYWNLLLRIHLTLNTQRITYMTQLPHSIVFNYLFNKFVYDMTTHNVVWWKEKSKCDESSHPNWITSQLWLLIIFYFAPMKFFISNSTLNKKMQINIYVGQNCMQTSDIPSWMICLRLFIERVK